MTNEAYKILLVEDDTALGYLLNEYLGMKGFIMHWEKHPSKVLALMEEKSFDLLILDVMMPDTDGFTLGEKIHHRFPEVPFIFLTPKSLKIDVLKGFAAGAVDYLKKPIDEEELVVRISALLARLGKDSGPSAASQFDLGSYKFDSLNQELQWQDQKIQLTTRENELLKYLVQHKDRLCTHSEILKKIWGRNDYFNRKSLNVFITHLRKHLENDPDLKIDNIHGQGFILRTS